MKCAKDKLGVKISQSNINMDLSIKMDTGSNQIVDIFFIVLCFKMLLSFYYFSRILLSNLLFTLWIINAKALTRQAVTPLWNAV